MKIKNGIFSPSRSKEVVGVSIGVFCSVVISMVLLSAFVGLSISGRTFGVLEKLTPFAIRFVSVLIGVLVGTGQVKEKWLIISGCIVFGYLCLLILLCIIAFNGIFNGLWTGVLSTIIGGGLGCIIRVKLQNRPLKHRKAKR